jgi:site-specific DNA recombinase
LATIVDLYCRVSTDPQEENTSLEEQERAGREYCREHGLIISMVHRETWSGYEYRERKKLTLIRERYRDGKIQGVVIRTLDRLSRSQTHVAILMEEMEHYGVSLHSVKEVIDDTPMGKFARMVLAFVAEMEREKILDRTLTGRVNAAKNGKVVSGTKALYGLQWVFDDKGERDYLELHPEQSAVLQRAAEEYAAGESLYQIINRFTAEGIAPPKGEHWHVRTLRRILTDPRMTGQNVKIFTVKNKRAKQHLDPVELPEGTYPRILSDELYQKVLDRATTNSALATRNSRMPEKYLLRAGFVKCAYCTYVMTSKSFIKNCREYPLYMCPNNHTDCKHFTVPSDKLDEAVWHTVSRLADHIALLEQSIELAMKNGSVTEDLKAVEATLAEWKQKVQNYHGDLGNSKLRGDTRLGVLDLLDKANAMVERLENDRAELAVFTVNREREREEYEKTLAGCKRVKREGEEMSYTMKRDFLRLLGAYVLVERLEKRNADPKWDIKVRLPEVEAIIYKYRIEQVGLTGGPPCRYELRVAH